MFDSIARSVKKEPLAFLAIIVAIFAAVPSYYSILSKPEVSISMECFDPKFELRGKFSVSENKINDGKDLFFNIPTQCRIYNEGSDSASIVSLASWMYRVAGNANKGAYGLVTSFDRFIEEEKRISFPYRLEKSDGFIVRTNFSYMIGVIHNDQEDTCFTKETTMGIPVEVASRCINNSIISGDIVLPSVLVGGNTYRGYIIAELPNGKTLSSVSSYILKFPVVD